MINIDVWSEKNIAIENVDYYIENQEDMLKFLKDLLDKVHYSGETICLEKVEIMEYEGRTPENRFTEIERWK